MKVRYFADTDTLLIEFLDSPVTETRDLDEQTREAIHFLPEAAHAFIRCPSCKSPDYRVQAGRGVSIASITLDSSKNCT